MRERRRETRMLCADVVDVRWSDFDHSEAVNLEDISASGACLLCQWPIALSTPLRISYPNGELTGTVRYCQLQDVGYLVGVQFDAGCQWSPQTYRPQHLLNPRELFWDATNRVPQDQPAHAPVSAETTSLLALAIRFHRQSVS
jgi:hypothetical protein